MRGRTLAPERILVELKRTLFFAGLLSIAFAWSAISLYGQLPGSERHLVILFASMAAVGCAYGLTSFPAAARLPLLLFALPFAARLVASGNAAHAGVGISLGLITLMILRLVNLHNEGFVQLVWSRSEVETERERAQRAEQEALAEKARVRQVADTDSLTGLANRRAFIAELETRLGPRRPGAALRARAARPRRLQADQRHVRPCRRRRPADRGRGAAARRGRRGRFGGADRRRRIRPDPALRQRDGGDARRRAGLRRARAALSWSTAANSGSRPAAASPCSSRGARRRPPRSARATPRSTAASRTGAAASPCSRRRSPRRIGAASRSSGRCATRM